MFVKNNQGDEETTKINYLTFIGTPVQATNMNDFKRVISGIPPSISYETMMLTELNCVVYYYFFLYPALGSGLSSDEA